MFHFTFHLSLLLFVVFRAVLEKMAPLEYLVHQENRFVIVCKTKMLCVKLCRILKYFRILQVFEPAFVITLCGLLNSAEKSYKNVKSDQFDVYYFYFVSQGPPGISGAKGDRGETGAAVSMPYLIFLFD